MSHRIGEIVLLGPEPPQACELCGVVSELRPYGPKGERICFDCMKKDEESAKRQFRQIMLGENIQ